MRQLRHLCFQAQGLQLKKQDLDNDTMLGLFHKNHIFYATHCLPVHSCLCSTQADIYFQISYILVYFIIFLTYSTASDGVHFHDDGDHKLHLIELKLISQVFNVNALFVYFSKSFRLLLEMYECEKFRVSRTCLGECLKFTPTEFKQFY